MESHFKVHVSHGYGSWPKSVKASELYCAVSWKSVCVCVYIYILIN